MRYFGENNLKEMKGKDLIIGLGKTEPTSHENSQ
jgi:hypothetical protein